MQDTLMLPFAKIVELHIFLSNRLLFSFYIRLNERQIMLRQLKRFSDKQWMDISRKF